jgi:hypothetical protein
MESKDENLKIIDRFTKETGYDFLSNFYTSTVRFEGVLYPTVEHAYQASKTTDLRLREIIKRAANPLEAKKLGKCLKLREDWESVRIEIMRKLIREKFENPFLGHLLLKTDDAKLIMNNKFNDRFWGVYKGSGENWLGKILEEVREELRYAEAIDVV